MQALLELIKYTIPSLVVFATAFYILRLFLEKEASKLNDASKVDIQKAFLPVRVQAYERLVLLIERIEPAGLVLRTNEPGMSAVQLQNALVQTIRSEFEHNLSQQLYVSKKVWEMVRNAREESIKRINAAAMKLPADASSADLASLLLLSDIETENTTLHAAMDALKSEARLNFF